MSVDDNYRESLRKTAEQVTQGDNTEYYFKVKEQDSQGLADKINRVAESGALNQYEILSLCIFEKILLNLEKIELILSESTEIRPE